MTNVQEIEQAVSHLSPEELARFREWFEEFDGGRWDKQIEQDAAGGRLESLATQAIADFRMY